VALDKCSYFSSFFHLSALGVCVCVFVGMCVSAGFKFNNIENHKKAIFSELTFLVCASHTS